MSCSPAHPSALKFLIWAANLVGNSEASNRSMRPTPLFPASKLRNVQIEAGSCSLAQQRIHHVGLLRLSSARVPVIEGVHVIAKTRGDSHAGDDDPLRWVPRRCLAHDGAACPCDGHEALVTQPWQFRHGLYSPCARYPLSHDLHAYRCLGCEDEYAAL